MKIFFSQHDVCVKTVLYNGSLKLTLTIAFAINESYNYLYHICDNHFKHFSDIAGVTLSR